MDKADYLDFIGKVVTVVIDRPMGSYHPKHGHLYPVNYGYIPGTLAGDGKEIDAYILGLDKPILEFKSVVLAVIHRLDDLEDKLSWYLSV
ncbi:MAG: inorganic diphosphatase [Trueperaceae bacterium]|nr:inorganic diphosphatase [Trueperaceae bacterium]